ncbi:MAG: hypothetical protein ABI629_24740 [bacterium]
MSRHDRGLYETLITEEIDAQLGELGDALEVRLGPATYVKHESELPMAVTWRLAHALPGDLFTSFAAAVA